MGRPARYRAYKVMFSLSDRRGTAGRCRNGSQSSRLLTVATVTVSPAAV